MRKISQTVLILGFVSFFTDVSSEMIYPLLPVFLATQLGATPMAIGLIEGIAETTASILKLASGWWADRIPRKKPLIVAGYGLSGLMRPLIGFALMWPMVLVIRFMDRIGKGIRSSPRDALIADTTPLESRGAAYGFHRAMDHAGAATGPLIASALLLLPGFTTRQVFLAAGVPALAAFLTLVFFLREEKRERAPARIPVAPDSRFPLFSSFKQLDSRVKGLLLAVFVFTLGNSTDAFLLLKLTSAGVPASSIALLWALHHFVKMAANYYGGRFVDRKGPRPALLGGWFLYAVFYAGFALTDDSRALVALFLAYGLYYGLVEPSEKTFVASLAPASVRGTAFGSYHFIVGLGALPASLIFGYLWTTFSSAAAFAFGAGAAILASLLVAFFLQPSGDARHTP